MVSSFLKRTVATLKSFAATPEGLLVITLIILGSFLRLYRLPETIHFQGDQGRDAILVKRMLTEGNLPFIGPVTSVGNLYLGPFYYYYMAPWMALTYPSPVGPVIGVALANILSLVLLYVLVKKMFGWNAALFSLLLYTVMDTAIIHSRFSWNPNIMPLLMLAILYCLRLAEKKPNYLAFVWLLFGLIIQLHYMALVLGGVIVIYSLYLVVSQVRRKRQILTWSLIGLGLFLMTLVPQIAFDLKNRGILSQGFIRFFTGDEVHISAASHRLSLTAKLIDRLEFLLFDLFRLSSPFASLWLLFSLASSWVFAAYKKYYSLQNQLLIGLVVIMTWIGSYLYTSSVHEHYVAFFFPVAAIIWGVALGTVYKTHLIGKGLVVLLLLVMAVINLRQAHPFTAEAKPLSRFQRVVDVTRPFLLADKKYNLAMIADDREYKALNYRYFFEVSDNPPAHEDDYDDLEQLVVIAETKNIDPVGLSPIEFHPLHEMNLVKRILQTDGPDILIYSRND